MDIPYQYSLHFVLLLVVTTSISTGIIFNKNKNISNALIFTGFTLFSFTLFSGLYLGEVREAYEVGENTIRQPAFLSIIQSLIIEVVAYMCFSIGYIIKVVKITKNR